MQDNIPDALIAAFERHYDCSWDDPALRNERLAWRAAWAEAMESKQCLHQIQEPVPVLAAPAAVAVPVELLERVIDSLSSFAGNKPHTEADMAAWEQLNDLLSAAPPAGWKLVPIEPTAEMLESAGATDCDGTPATYKTLYMAMVGAALNPPPACDTPRYCNSVQRCTAMDEQRAAAAPVVLPEPRWHNPSPHDAAHFPYYTPDDVRALLAGVSAPAAPTEQQILDAAEKAGLWPNTVQSWIPAFKRYHAALAAAPQAQADARDAESDYQRGYRHGYNRRDAEVQGALL